jgi:hypothetical protein
MVPIYRVSCSDIYHSFTWRRSATGTENNSRLMSTIHPNGRVADTDYSAKQEPFTSITLQRFVELIVIINPLRWRSNEPSLFITRKARLGYSSAQMRRILALQLKANGICDFRLVFVLVGDVITSCSAPMAVQRFHIPGSDPRMPVNQP